MSMPLSRTDEDRHAVAMIADRADGGTEGALTGDDCSVVMNSSTTCVRADGHANGLHVEINPGSDCPDRPRAGIRFRYS